MPLDENRSPVEEFEAAFAEITQENVQNHPANTLGADQQQDEIDSPEQPVINENPLDNPDAELSEHEGDGPSEEDSGEQTPTEPELDDNGKPKRGRPSKAELEARTWKGRLEKTNQELKELREKLKEKEEAEKAEPPKEDTRELDAAISALKDDYPEIYTGVEMLLRKELSAALHVLWQNVQQLVTPVAKITENQAQKEHWKQIVDKHPDVQEILSSGALADWIETKRGRDKATCIEVTQSGTADDVIDLLDRYKRETGYGTASEQAKERIAQKAAEKKAQLDALRSVKSTPAKPATQRRESQIPDDYQAAFDAITQGE